MVRKFLCYGESTLKAMNGQRHGRLLCDVKIIVDDGHVFAHKAVLAACSPYFHSMFTGGFTEGESPFAEVDMSKVFPDLSTAEHVIQSMYTDQLDVTPDNVCTLYGVFSFLLFDKPKLICEAFMSECLSWDTCVEYFELTYYHNLSGDLHKRAKDLLANRFHDHCVYQEYVLHVPRSAISILLQEHITKFCSPRQILTFLINWFLKSDLMEGNVLRELVLEAQLPDMCNIPQMMYEIQSSMAMTRSNRQLLAEVCEEIHSEDVEHGKHITKCCSPRQILTFPINAVAMHSRRPIGKTQATVNDADPVKCLNTETQLGLLTDMSSEKDFSSTEDLLVKMEELSVEYSDKTLDKQACGARTSEGNEHADEECRELEDTSRALYPICDGKIPISPGYECAVDAARCHFSGDILQETERLDVILAIAPELTGTQEEENPPRQLRLFAYVTRAQLWINLGIIGYPTGEGGKAMLICESQFYAAGESIFLLFGKKLFFSRVPWEEWKRVVLPSDGGGESLMRLIFPLPLKNTMYLILRDKVDKTVGGDRVTYNRVILGMITKDGQWEEIINYKEKTNANIHVYGPCWVEQSCFLVHRCDSATPDNWEFMLLNPDRKDIQFVASQGGKRDRRSMKYILGTWPHFLEHGAWNYACKRKSKYEQSSGKVLLRFQLNDDQSYVSIEEPAEGIVFKTHGNESRTLDICALKPDCPPSQVSITSGPCLWRFSNTTMEKSFLHELNLQQPDVEIEHTPPPCNVILAATAATMDNTFLSNQPLARYHHICDPIKEKNTCARLNYDSDEYSWMGQSW